MTDLIKLLQSLIGRRLMYDGVHCQVIEVLTEGPSVVLTRIGDEGVIQPDQYGDARRRVPQTYTIPLLSSIEDDLHPVIRAAADDEQIERLRHMTR